MPAKGSRKTHCKHGHFQEEGWKRCKTCKNRTAQKSYHKTMADPEYRENTNARKVAERNAKPENIERHRNCNREGERERSKDQDYRDAKNARQQVRRDSDEARAKAATYQNARKETDVNFKISAALRTRLYMAVKRGSKVGSAVTDLGCSIEEFKCFIENQFTEGMSWDNYGKWHLDHVRPLAAFNLEDRTQFLEVANWTNYQPLWAEDNIRKGSKET